MSPHPVERAARDRAKLAVAKQLAVSQGQVWDRLQVKMQHLHLTISENIIATIERSMAGFQW